MHVQSLDGSWQLSKIGANDWIPATVPGSVHVDLMRAGVIPDPFYADNEARVAWVAEADWVYRRTFQPDESLLSHDRIFLECDGLDTLAVVRLNDEVIGRTDNMHRRYRFDVTGRVRPGENTIEVELASPVRYASDRIARGQGLVITPGDSIPGSPFLRKAMYQWGWDWAQKLPTSGIWRPIRLVGHSVARLADVHVRQRHDENAATLTIKAELERFSDDNLTLQAKVTSPDGDESWQSADLGRDASGASLEFLIECPDLWWPNGFGHQPLYHVEVELLPATKRAVREKGQVLIDRRSVRIGLRSLELRQKTDEWGRSFAFAINGVPIFCKGANWVPADQFPTRMTDDDYHDLIQSAAWANMNMLRVWGGGIYEDDRFYDLCDEHGILVWQDFMFACAHYPTDPEMLENIRAEAVDNIRRLRRHPCLVLWCGSNEMEWFLSDEWSSLEHLEERRQQFGEVFYRLLPDACSAEDPDTPYWPSSPSSGMPFKDANGEVEGDGHYWEVWHGRKPFIAYRERYYRFVSEFGFESLPSIDTVKSFAEPKDWSITSHVMEAHQKNRAGNELILYYLAQTFRSPRDFPMMVYVSQILQAEAIRYGVEHWRRNRGGNRCMGALYWQLNDCWPVASWSGIEHNHHWKALHYCARRFYSPVLLSTEEANGVTKLHVTNDRPEPFRGEVRWSLECLDGTRIEEECIQVDAPPESSACVADLKFLDKLDQDAQRKSVLVYELWQRDRRLSLGMASFVLSKDLELLEANISSRVREDGGKIEIEITSDKTARFVMLDVPEHSIRFSDNFFDLLARQTIAIGIEDPAGLSADEIRNKLRAVSLRDSYY